MNRETARAYISSRINVLSENLNDTHQFLHGVE